MEKQNCGISAGEDSKPNYKVKLMCSYGGKIQQRPHDHQLTYAGGDTKIFTVQRRIKFSDIVVKLISLSHVITIDVVSFKYQLPGEDLDALVSVINDDDLEHMMAEYDRIYNTISSKPARLRLFLFSPNRPINLSGLDHLKTQSTSPPLNPDFLFGFDKEYEYDSQTHSVPESHTPQSSGLVRPDFTGLDSRNREVIQPLVYGIQYPQGLHSTCSYRSSHVTSRVYGISTVRVVPVNEFFPAIATAATAINGVGLEEKRGVAYVAADDGGRSEVYNGVRDCSASWLIWSSILCWWNIQWCAPDCIRSCLDWWWS